jgi:hypothetical protein
MPLTQRDVEVVTFLAKSTAWLGRDNAFARMDQDAYWTILSHSEQAWRLLDARNRFLKDADRPDLSDLCVGLWP